MSQTAIFLVGILVFAVTVWGSVMVGGYWLTEIAESEDEDQPQSNPEPPSPPSA